MKIDLKIIPSAKKELIKSEGPVWKVYLTAPAVDGKANKALISLMARHSGVKKSQIKIIKGLKSRHKTISIE